jgi:glycosyltransferase involved in cell wall biosynthesis
MPQMGLGGSERLVHSLALRLDRSRFSPSVAWLYGDQVLQQFQDLRIPLHHVPKVKRLDFGTMRALARIVRAENIDVVNAQHFMPAVYAYYGCNLAARKPLVYTVHSRWEVEEIPLKWRIAGAYALNRIGASVAVSPDVCAAVRGVFGLDASRVVTIENGVDLDAFAAEKDVRALRGSLRLAEGDVVIGIVANLKKVKNHLFLLRAFAEVARELGNVRLLLVGQGFPGEQDNTEDELRRFVAQHGLGEKVSFLGHRADVPELLRAMDVFCLTSLREGLPIGLIEAMAAGLPVVGTNVEGIRDVITPEEDGVLVEPGDVAALKNALARLAQDEQRRKALGRSGRRKAAEKYSLQRCVREYERLFAALATRAS